MIPKHEKFSCENCKKEYRRKKLIFFKGRFLCYKCRRSFNIEGSTTNQVPFVRDMKELLDKVYEIRAVGKNKGFQVAGHTNFNRQLIGKKFKLQIIEEK